MKTIIIDMAYISIEKISFHYEGRLILKDISLLVERGEKILIAGDNGVGKSTLLNLLAGNLLPQSGNINVLGVDTKLHRKNINSKIGYLGCSDKGLFPNLTGTENINFFSELCNLNAKTILDRVERWSELISPFEMALETPYFKCSNGMKQLLNLFIATLHFPSVVLLDEPFRSLARDYIRPILDLIEAEKKDRCIVMAAHESNTEDKYWNNLYQLKEGRLVSEIDF